VKGNTPIIAGVVAIFALLALVAYRSGVLTPPEPVMKAGDKISGKNKGYALTVPDGGWLPMPEGRRAVGGDLELSGRDGEAILVAFATCEGFTLDDVVAFRRSEMAKRLAEMKVEESRRFDPNADLYVSTTRYSGFEDIGPSIVWTSAAVDGRLAVEVIVHVLGEEPEDELAARDIVGSLEILGEEKGCAPG
jgi:hypothetical protein